MYCKRLKELREKSGRTKKNIAGILGISESTYDKCEKGEQDLSAVHIRRLAYLYKVSCDYIFEITDNPHHVSQK